MLLEVDDDGDVVDGLRSLVSQQLRCQHVDVKESTPEDLWDELRNFCALARARWLLVVNNVDSQKLLKGGDTQSTRPVSPLRDLLPPLGKYGAILITTRASVRVLKKQLRLPSTQPLPVNASTGAGAGAGADADAGAGASAGAGAGAGAGASAGAGAGAADEVGSRLRALSDRFFVAFPSELITVFELLKSVSSDDPCSEYLYTVAGVCEARRMSALPSLRQC